MTSLSPTMTDRSEPAATAVRGMATSEENAAKVRRGYHAFNTADMALLAEILDENATWQTPGRSSMAGLRKGRDAVFAHFGRYGAETGGSFKAELRYVLADGEGRVVGVHRNVGERNGKHLDVMCCIVFEIRDGRMISGKEHFFDLYAWDAFWS